MDKIKGLKAHLNDIIMFILCQLHIKKDVLKINISIKTSFYKIIVC